MVTERPASRRHRQPARDRHRPLGAARPPPAYRDRLAQSRDRERLRREDPIFHASHASQPVQMADVIAWTTCQSLLKHPGKTANWGWYDEYLKAADVNGGSVELT